MKKKIIIAFVLTQLLCSLVYAKALDGWNEYTAGDDGNNSAKQDVIIPVMRNRVHKAGLFWLNITNNGYFGNPNGDKDVCTGRAAVSGELPGGSGTDFLFVGALGFGGYLANGDQTEYGTEFEGPYTTTSFEGWTGSPMPMEAWPVKFEEDPSGSTMGQITETSNIEGKLSCSNFSDVYDPFSKAEEQYTTYYTDKYVENNDTGKDEFADEEMTYNGRPTTQHVPLGIEVKQASYAWSKTYLYKFVIIDYMLYKRNEDQKDIYDFFMGMYLDCDIGKIDTGAGISENHADDIGGFIQKWEKFDIATGETNIYDLNMAWAADNDGRAYTGSDGDGNMNEPGAGEPLTENLDAVATLRVLRNPNPSLKYAFNMYVAGSSNESVDWGPRWKQGLHGPGTTAVDGQDPLVWDYDLSIRQKGYDDTNYDNLKNGSVPLAGGRTEGRPAGDVGKYMVMSNDEFDYNQYELTTDENDFQDPDYLPLDSPFRQARKWQPWILPNTPGYPVADGTEDDMNDLKNGADVKYVLSFGPLGAETNVDVAYDNDGADGDGNYEINASKNKKVWKFAYGDSLKLTLAYIVNNGFHRSLDQDPNIGLDPELYKDGWEEAVDNVLWAEKVYDMPMTDTQVRDASGNEKGDGWYGEDVGADGLFSDVGICWWTDPASPYLAKDSGENDGEITEFTTPITDIDGNVATSEDNLLKYGNKYAYGGYGITGDAISGANGYGYMVYDYVNSEWVRFGYNNDKLDLGDGVPDLSAPPPPPAPKVKVETVNDNIIVRWSSHEFKTLPTGDVSIIGPEHTEDTFSKIIDFEGYKIMVSDTGIDKVSFSTIASFDKINYIYQNVSDRSVYLDFPIVTNNPDTLDQIVTDENNNLFVLQPFGQNRSLYTPVTTELYDFNPTSREVEVSEGNFVTVWDYEFILKNTPYGKRGYISVSAFDSGDPAAGVPQDGSNPIVNKVLATPSSLSDDNKDSDKVWVVPNPYRGDVDYEKINWESVDGVDNWVEDERKIVFMNVPARSVLKIFTLAGDLVKTIRHNGYANTEELYNYDLNAINWNLINENNQAVASGIYLYSVKDLDDDNFEHVGKFVIIK